MRRLDRYRLVVFDWDGTLVDSAQRIVASLARAAAAADLPPRPEPALRHVIGLGLGEALAALYPALDEARAARFLEAYRRAYLHEVTVPAPLFADARPLLEALRAAGRMLAVATGKSRAGLARALREHDLETRFDATRCADEAPSKPDPTMLRELLECCAVPPEAALMVGDTCFDVEMAHAAGVEVAAVARGAHPREALVAARPTVLLEDLAALGRWLGIQAPP